MYKKYYFIPKNLSLVLNFKNRKVELNFEEPTLYNLFLAEELLKEEKHFEALNILGIKIKESDFLSNPTGILQNIFKLCYGNKDEKKDNSEPGFLPSTFDFIAKRYGKSPTELLKEITPSVLETYLAGIEFNMNIENDKKRENYKFKQKKKISDEEMKKYDKIMEELSKHPKFRKN